MCGWFLAQWRAIEVMREVCFYDRRRHGRGYGEGVEDHAPNVTAPLQLLTFQRRLNIAIPYRCQGVTSDAILMVNSILVANRNIPNICVLLRKEVDSRRDDGWCLCIVHSGPLSTSQTACQASNVKLYGSAPDDDALANYCTAKAA